MTPPPPQDTTTAPADPDKFNPNHAVTVEDGEIITAPGVYDMDIEWYHQQCCDGPSLSSTGIRRILSSPAEFWKFSGLNPNRVEEPSKASYVLGKGAHHLALGEANFAKSFTLQPSVYRDPATNKDKAWNNNATVCREWHKDQADAGLTVLTPAQLEQIKGMAGLLPWQKGMINCGLANTPLITEGGALSGDIERSLIFKRGNVWLKARPDAIPGSSNDFTDLKTTGTGIDDRDLSKTELDRGYYVQGALVGVAAHEVLGRVMEGFHLVFVDTGNVHAVSIKTLVEEDIIRGERSIDVAVKIFERCMDSGIWPGPTAWQADAQKLSLPQYGREKIDRHLDQLEMEYL